VPGGGAAFDGEAFRGVAALAGALSSPVEALAEAADVDVAWGFVAAAARAFAVEAGGSALWAAPFASRVGTGEFEAPSSDEVGEPVLRIHAIATSTITTSPTTAASTPLR